MNGEGAHVVGIAARGDGVTADGRHAPLTAPGDYVHHDGSVEAGPHHQMAPCRHFPECGGCQLQHLDDGSYARFLVDRIIGALAQHGLKTEVREAMLSPPRSRRRTTLHAERRGRQVHIGFTAQRSHHLVDMMECEILHPDLFRLLTPLRGLLAAMLPRTGRSDVSLTLVDQGVDVMLSGMNANDLATAEAITGFARRHHLARLAIDEGFGPETRWEPDPVTITLGGIPVGMPAGAFLQATGEGEAVLVDSMREIVGDSGAVADLFAGLGTFALALPSSSRVYAAEAARDAVLSLKSAANRTQRQVFADHRDLYRRPLTADECNRFGAVVLDPPRAGAKEQVAELARSTVTRVAYISCNPSTFARDAAILCEGGMQLDWVQPVGQFRWSTHVELAAAFSR